MSAGSKAFGHLGSGRRFRLCGRPLRFDDRAKGSDTVRHIERAEAVDSCIRIGRMGGVQLVAISNPGRFTPVFELLHEFQVVIGWLGFRPSILLCAAIVGLFPLALVSRGVDRTARVNTFSVP